MSYNPKRHGFINPIKPVGEVLLNGRISQGAVITATSNKNPLYPMPVGQYSDKVAKVRRADIVYRFIDEVEYVETSYTRHNNATVTGIAALNGQGIYGENQQDFMSRIQPLGLAFMDNETTDSDLFNIHTGGIYTIMNVSNVDICAGDTLMAYAPLPHEAASGGRGEDADANGLVTLWLVPYHPKIHQNTTDAIYNCLTRINEIGPSSHHTIDGKMYMPQYEEQCKELMDSYMDIIMIGAQFLISERVLAFGDNMPNGTAADNWYTILTHLGHTNFHSQTHKNSEFRQRLINALFLDRIPRSLEAFQVANLFPEKTNESMALKNCQLDGVSLGLQTQARFIKGMTKLIMGKAITSMKPKENGEFQLMAYTGCK